MVASGPFAAYAAIVAIVAIVVADAFAHWQAVVVAKDTAAASPSAGL